MAVFVAPGRGAKLGAVAFGAAAVVGAAAWREQRRRMQDDALWKPGREVKVADRRLWVHESGPVSSDRPAVVLLTGAGDQGASWLLVRRRLSESFRVVGYDRVGMGSTDDRPGPRTLHGYVDELAGVLAAVQLVGPVVLVGHSFGGLIAQAYAAANPTRLTGLVLVDAVSPRINSSRAMRVSLALNVAAARTLRALSPLGVPRALFAIRAMPLYPEQRVLRAAASAVEYRRWVGAMCAGFAGNATREIAAVLPGAAEFPEPAETVGGPVTVIHGRLVGKPWSRQQKDLAARYQDSTRVCTGSRFHNIHLSRHDLIVDAVHNLLATPRP